MNERERGTNRKQTHTQQMHTGTHTHTHTHTADAHRHTHTHRADRHTDAHRQSRQTQTHTPLLLCIVMVELLLLLLRQVLRLVLHGLLILPDLLLQRLDGHLWRAAGGTAGVRPEVRQHNKQRDVNRWQRSERSVGSPGGSLARPRLLRAA